ncbi:hypothetical protein BT96DRAFT_1008785 [Gymnopus androsaceus JB14]|uniref:Uncharacterized protein n=1 Tax=Gymnopus androsaceus JB14 TaxID=1447944 RepID=A0A6A4GEC0_9AGAR|nr:hypothetical protein BT96DRAFT_1008785 [Gymnopus androsaceus JB14]
MAAAENLACPLSIHADTGLSYKSGKRSFNWYLVVANGAQLNQEGAYVEFLNAKYAAQDISGDYKGFNAKDDMFAYWIEHCQKRHKHDKDPSICQPFVDPIGPPSSPPSTPPVSRSPSPVPQTLQRTREGTPGPSTPHRSTPHGLRRPANATPIPSTLLAFAEHVRTRDGQQHAENSLVYYSVKTNRGIVSTVNHERAQRVFHTAVVAVDDPMLLRMQDEDCLFDFIYE